MLLQGLKTMIYHQFSVRAIRCIFIALALVSSSSYASFPATQPAAACGAAICDEYSTYCTSGQTARSSTYTYDNVGQLTGVTNPDGSTLSYTYDAAHRLVGATDAKGNNVTYTLDNMGNRIKEDIKDPTGVLQRSIERSFDALNRLQQVSWAVQ